MIACADCGHVPSVDDKPIDTMIALRARSGEWFLCARCYGESLRFAEECRLEREAKLAAIENRQRQTHQRERVGSHG